MLSFGPLLLCCHFFFGLSKNCRLPPPSTQRGVPRGRLGSWGDLFGSKRICFPKQTGSPLQTRCHGEEGLFPRSAELAPPSSKTDKARSTSGGVSWAVGRSISKTHCSLSIFLPPSNCSLRREQFTFGECSQVSERLNIQCACGQDKSNLVCLQELKGGIEGRHPKALTLLVAKRVLVRSSLPESCSSLVSMLPPLMRWVPSVPQSLGDGWLDPVSEDFNMTKVMTLARGKGGAPWVGFTAPGWFS